MSTNRRTRAWPVRAQLTPELIALFARLETVSVRRRNSQEFKDSEKS
jgi:hypothetical protein